MLAVLRAAPARRPDQRVAAPRRSRSPTGRSTWWSRPRRSTGSTTTRALPEIARVLRPGGALARRLEPPRTPDPVGAQAAGRSWASSRTLKEGTDDSDATRSCSRDLFGFVDRQDLPLLAGRQPRVDRRPGRVAQLRRRRSTRTPARRSSRRCWRSTTTTAAAWTACSSPTSASATGPTVVDRADPEPASDGRGRRRADEPDRGAGDPATAPTPTCCSSTSADRRTRG